MTAPTTNSYLRDAVMTATPEQLQLMLYDGAIRFATQARDAITAKDHEASYNKLSRAQAIVLEMQAGLRPEVNPDLCERMSALYSFVYRKLVDASVHRRMDELDDALKVLHHMRETWVMLVNKLAKARGEHDSNGAETDGAGSTTVSSPDDVEVGGSLSIEG